MERDAFERARSAYGTGAYDDATLEFVFPQLKESEDERIRKDIVALILFALEDGSAVSPGSHTTKEEALAYLEKQKEQKPSIPKFRVGDMMRTKQEAAEGIIDGLPVIVSVDDDYYYCTNEKIPITEQEEYEFPPMNMRQKPAEWSEEDDWKRKELIQYLEEKGDYRIVWMTWLKSLRPSWKPSDEQILAIVEALKYLPNNKDEWMILNTLIAVLRKLM